MSTRKSGSNHLAGVVFLALFVTGVAYSLLGDVLHREKAAPEPVPVELNATLTNDMSSCDALVPLDTAVIRYMRRWEIVGAGLAVMRNDSLVFCKGYGWEDDSLCVEMRPGTLMRLASVSKLITAAGIMILCERDSLSLSDKVFGEDGIFGGEYDKSIRDKRCYDITVEQLLRHEGGLSSRRGDPMFSGVWYPSRDNLVRNALHRWLSFPPGSGSEYSNFGYLLLSMVIEKVTGEEYEYWMQENVLRRARCSDMHIASNTYEERFQGEGRYHGYGSNDIHMLSGAGAWVSSVAELARFVASIDGDPGVQDIISESSFRQMTAATDSVKYGIGWTDIKPDGEMTRTGTLSSSTALIKDYPDGECWIFVTNSGTWKGPRFSKYTTSFFRECREKFSAVLPRQDLFY